MIKYTEDGLHTVTTIYPVAMHFPTIQSITYNVIQKSLQGPVTTYLIYILKLVLFVCACNEIDIIFLELKRSYPTKCLLCMVLKSWYVHILVYHT